MSLWIKNAVIATMDANNPAAESAVVVGRFFAYVGSGAGAEAWLSEHPQKELSVVDCGGAFLMPGFNDSHMHYLHYVKAKKSSVNLTGCSSLREVIERMKTGFAESYDRSSGLWLTGEGWNQDYFTDEKRFPTADDLDEVTADYPILIMRTCFHIGVMNSKAMEMLGIDKNSAGCYGPYAETRPDGTPNGVVKEGVVDEIKSNLPAPNLGQLLDMMIECQEDLFRCGVTSVQSDDVKYVPEGKAFDMLALLRTAAEDGRLKLRIAEQALMPTIGEMNCFFDEKGLDGSYGNDTFKISCAKILSDGSLGARTAFMRKPYADAPDTRGIAVYTQDELDALVMKAHSMNTGAAIHAIGDGAVEMCLNAIERARREMPYLHPRHGIVHCQITDKEQIARFAELNVIAYIQPIFIDYDMHIVYDRVGEELAKTSYAWKDYIKLGVHAPFGTDCPVEPFRPLPGIYCAVARRDLKGRGPYLPDQKLTREQALYAYTAEGAYASRDENIKGKIKAGMYADFITTDTNLLTCSDEEILTASVTRTYVGGQCVYQS